ncbi:hypothetical protein FRC00_007061 [Tulasnella sp. 408]|nr:hypothetical protein FRC00_007061 [Tulasnella sp. 408]
MDGLAVLETSVLEPLDPAFVEKTLSAPPFYQIEGVLNVRNIPLPPTTSKRGLILRSGETNHISSLGRTKISQDLGIIKIFDLRSDKERAKFGSDSALNIPNVEVICVPARTVEPKEDLKTIFGRFGGTGDQGFVDAYRAILEQGKRAFRGIFEFLAGVSDEEIMRDYALTRVGAEPMREATVVRFAELLQDPDRAESAANALGCRPSAMRATLAMLREEYGGAAGYLKNHLGFSGDDVGRMVRNLTSGRA